MQLICRAEQLLWGNGDDVNDRRIGRKEIKFLILFLFLFNIDFLNYLFSFLSSPVNLFIKFLSSFNSAIFITAITLKCISPFVLSFHKIKSLLAERERERERGKEREKKNAFFKAEGVFWSEGQKGKSIVHCFGTRWIYFVSFDERVLQSLNFINKGSFPIEKSALKNSARQWIKGKKK